MADLIERWREIGGESHTDDVGQPKSYTRIFQAFVRSNEVRSWQVKSDRRCPKRYAFDGDGGAYVKSVTAIRDRKVLRLFTVTVNYQANLPDEPEDDPLDRPADVTTKGIERQRPAIRDIDGKPIANTAGDLIAGAMVDVPGVIFAVTKNVSPAPQPWLLTSANRTNSDAITIDGLDCAAGTLLIRKPQIGSVTRENDIAFRVAQFEVHYDADGWDLTLWNRGFHAIVTEYGFNSRTGLAESIPRKVRITDDQGDPVTEPQFLDGDGRQFLEVGPDGIYRTKHPLDVDDLRAALLTFRVKHSIAYGDLPLA